MCSTCLRGVASEGDPNSLTRPIYHGPKVVVFPDNNTLICFQVYNGNINRNGIVINDLEAPIEARVIRINPVEWYGHISMRMELYGCRLPSGSYNVWLAYAMLRS